MLLPVNVSKIAGWVVNSVDPDQKYLLYFKLKVY